MFKKLLFLAALLVAAVVGLRIYAERAPESRVASVVGYVERSLPGLFAHGNLRGKDVIDLGKGAIDHAHRDAERQDGKAIIYKWRDGSGNWVFGNAPPAGVNAIPQEIDMSKTNRLAQ